MKNRRVLLIKTGTLLGVGAIASILPSQIGLSTASASTKVAKKAVKKVVHPKKAGKTGKTGSFLGQVAQTQFGPVRVQSSNIQGVGGASYTSQGFYTSLLSALAKAGHK